MTAAYCPRHARPFRTARCLLPGTVGPGTPPVAPELLDLGPHVGQVDGGRNEGDDREERDKLHAVRETAQADDGRHAKDDQPDRLCLLARRGERRGRPAQGVNEGPSLDDKRRQHEHFKEPEEWGHGPATEHPSRLSAIGGVCAPLTPKGPSGVRPRSPGRQMGRRAARRRASSPRREGRGLVPGVGAGSPGSFVGCQGGTPRSGRSPGGSDRPIPQGGRGQDLVDRDWLCLPLSAPLALLLRPLSARFPRLASLSYSPTARVRAVVTYPFARPDREPTDAWLRHLASRAGSSRSVSEASTPTPAAACTGLLSASLRISVLTSMVRFTNLTLLACRLGQASSPCAPALGRRSSFLGPVRLGVRNGCRLRRRASGQGRCGARSGPRIPRACAPPAGAPYAGASRACAPRACAPRAGGLRAGGLGAGAARTCARGARVPARCLGVGGRFRRCLRVERGLPAERLVDL